MRTVALAILYHRLSFAQQLAFDPDAAAALHMIHASGRGVSAHIPAGWVAFLMPLSGQIELESREGRWSLPSRRALLWREGDLHCVTRAHGLWLSLCGPLSAWLRYMRVTPNHPIPDLFPSEITVTRDLRRLLVRMARIAEGRPHERAAMRTLGEAFCCALIDSQADLHERVQHCKGRSLRRRQQNLLRLLRVRSLIQNHQHGKLDLERLARAASYSPSHLIRAYRKAFNETPSEYAARLRSDRAWTLVRTTQMPMCAIGEALGFESHSAFARAFKNTYGLTATQARRMQSDPITPDPNAGQGNRQVYDRIDLALDQRALNPRSPDLQAHLPQTPPVFDRGRWEQLRRDDVSETGGLAQARGKSSWDSCLKVAGD